VLSVLDRQKSKKSITPKAVITFGKQIKNEKAQKAEKHRK